MNDMVQSTQSRGSKELYITAIFNFPLFSSSLIDALLKSFEYFFFFSKENCYLLLLVLGLYLWFVY